jgi:hypothetical protein
MTEQRKDSLLLAFFLGFAIVILLSLFGAHVAWSHEWYPRACCSDKDCRPVACEDVHSIGDRWEYLGKSIAQSSTQASPDGACHACFNTWGVNLICIFLGGTS